jgi:hypothetical protein
VSTEQAGEVMGTMMPEFKATVKDEAEAAGVSEEEFRIWMGVQAGC